MSNNISNKAFDAAGISYNQYEEWCIENKKNPKKISVKEEFFRLFLDGRLVKENGKIVKKRIQKQN